MPRSTTESRQYVSRYGSNTSLPVTVGCTSQSIASMLIVRSPVASRLSAATSACRFDWLTQGEDVRHEFLIPVSDNAAMLPSAIAESAAPCPKCHADMVLAVVVPHPVAPQLGKHTYLCTRCNQTKTYVLPTDTAGAQ